MTKEKLIVVTDCNHDSLEIEKNILNQIPHKLRIFQCKSENEVIQNCRDADAIINQFAPLTDKVMCNLKNCKVIARYGLGVDGIDLKAATREGIIVANSGNYCISEVANHTIALILSFARGIINYNRIVKDNKWHFLSTKSIHRINNLVLGLFGYGKIAKEVAKRAFCLGFSVIAYDPFIKKSDNNRVKLVDFATLLEESDYLSIHSPLNSETKYRFRKDEFKAMKKTAYLINVGRGEIVNEADLCDALNREIISGAALDVLEKEPPIRSNPLLKMENVIITPHAAFYSEESYREYKITTTNAIITVLKGGVPDTIVNKELIAFQKTRSFKIKY